MPKNKFNEVGERLVHWKLEDIHTKNEKKTRINRKVVCDHGFEEVILLKSPYYLKQYTDSMQSLSQFQRHFSQK